jgi:FkbM family methyltransferase
MLKRSIVATIQPLVANHVYTVRHGLARGLRRRGGLGFLRPAGALSAEEAFLEQLDLEGQVVYDVGGYEGVMTLFFARRVGPTGQVLTFEPNPRNHDRIVENVRLNGFQNVTVHRVALGSAPGRASLVFPTDEPARGSIRDDIQEQIWQEQGAAVEVAAIEVAVDSIDHRIELGAPLPHFVKLDVEGVEYGILEGMAQLLSRHHPKLYIEVHGATPAKKLENATAIVERLWRSDYQIHHVESGLAIRTAPQIASAIEGHLYCR